MCYFRQQPLSAVSYRALLQGLFCVLCLQSAQHGLIQKAFEITFLSWEQGRDSFQVQSISCKSQNSVANITGNQSVFNRVDVSNFRVSSEERHKRNYEDLD